ncbi:mechanosensitive ion channel domain-containing protein [Proteinivorax hydrogeniformans]|uniref:Mechanosensitive ion channel domain-containing protein n=1 Tax=Proteinivorax hydrogeniformans TaxID=1826727 RepID=A0AAU8HW11_9FIRM
MENILAVILSYGGKLLLAVLFLAIGLTLIKRLSQFIASSIDKSDIDPSLKSFLIPLIKTILHILLLISIASMVGVEMTSFIAFISAIGFAIGLALQGSLSNFAGGVLILALKPFKVGDYIEANGYSGTVKDIQVFYTILTTPDNKKVIIPNANLSNSSAINYSAYDTRRIDFKFGVGYNDDTRKVKQVLHNIALEHPLILKEPEPMIVLGEHGDSSVVFYFRVWCESENYWTLYFELMETVKERFDKEGINIPYPQMDVHIQK